MDNRDFHTPPPPQSDLAPQSTQQSRPLPPPPSAPGRSFIRTGFRWLFILRMGLAAIVGLGLLLSGTFLMLTGRQGFDRNMLYLVLIGLAMFLVPGFFLLRTFRTMRAEKAASQAAPAHTVAR